MKIPITQLVDAVSVFALIVATIRLWKRYIQQKTLPLFLFASAFLAILLMMIMFALPFATVRYPFASQVMFYIADLMFMVAVALFTAVTISIILPTNRTLLIALPSTIGFVELLVFLWQISNPILPIIPITFFEWGNITLINYRNSASVSIRITEGIIAVCTFLIGAFLFFRQARSMEGAIHTRAFLLGLGYATAAVAVIANYIVGAFPELQAVSLFIASLLAFASVLFVYRGICVKIPNPLDRKTKNMYK